MWVWVCGTPKPPRSHGSNYLPASDKAGPCADRGRVGGTRSSALLFCLVSPPPPPHVPALCCLWFFVGFFRGPQGTKKQFKPSSRKTNSPVLTTGRCLSRAGRPAPRRLSAEAPLQRSRENKQCSGLSLCFASPSSVKFARGGVHSSIRTAA